MVSKKQEASKKQYRMLIQYSIHNLFHIKPVAQAATENNSISPKAHSASLKTISI